MTLRSTVLPMLILSLEGCSGVFQNACEWLGVCDPVSAAPETVSILCDDSRGASCTSKTLDSTVELAVNYLTGKPGSKVELWMLGSDVASTQVVAAFTITKAPKNGARPVQRFHQTQLDSARAFFLGQARPFLSQLMPGQSPLAAAIGKISLNTSPAGGAWHIIVITDALEYGDGWDFECSPPEDQPFAKSLRDNGLLTSTSLKRATVSFAFVASSKIDGNRCAVEIGRARRIRSVWTTALSATGAERVTFSSGLPQLEGVEP